jgi:hypothetical protein
MSEGSKPFILRSAATLVEAWSVKRLPFEPKDWLLDFRAALRGELARLDRTSPSCLHAAHTSADMSKCDVENACLYNVGLGAFRGLGADRVCVERAYELPPSSPGDLVGPAAHHYRYEVTGEAHPRHWQSTRVVAAWSDVALATPLTPAGVWWSMCRSSSVDALSTSDAVPLGIKVRVGSPAPARSLIQVMKVVLDGVISAFHAHSGSDGDEATARLTVALDQRDVSVRAALRNTDRNVLGERMLLWPFRIGLQWNPADDRLVSIQLEAVDADRLTVTGELYEAVPLLPNRDRPSLGIG